MAKKKDVIIHTGLVERVLSYKKPRNTWYSDYIVLHYRATGNLAPGCDAKDFYAFVDKYLEEKSGDGKQQTSDRVC